MLENHLKTSENIKYMLQIYRAFFCGWPEQTL